MQLGRSWTAVGFGLCLIYSDGRAQEKAPAPAAEETMVVAVSNIDARGVQNALNQLGFELMIAAPDAGRLVLRGQPEEIGRAVQLVRQLDEPEVPASSKESVAYLPLGNSPIKGIMGMVETVAPSGPGTAYALDQINRTLVVRANEATIGKVRELVKAVDRPAETLKVEFFFMRGTVLSEDGGGKGEVPPWLKPVAEALASGGFQNLTLLTPVSITTRPGEDFTSTSALVSGDEELTFLVRGAADVSRGGDVVQLEIDLATKALNVKRQAGGEAVNVSHEQVFQAKTAVSARLGKLTALAAAPAATSEKAAMAVAIRVTRAD